MRNLVRPVSRAVTCVLVAVALAACSASENRDRAAATPANPAVEASAKLVWLDDLAAAKKQAAEKKLPILANFSGSDWCGWCIRLDREVFSQPEFAAYASSNLVLLVLDFPRRSAQPPALAEQNRKLAETYGVRGFPTVLLLDAGGKVISQTGYQPGGAASYVEHLKSLLKP